MIVSKETRERLTAWWEHQDMDRPGFNISVINNKAAISCTEDLEKHWKDADFILDREMAVIDNSTYYCEAVPHHYINFGSAPLSACLGGDLTFVDKATTWSVPFVSKIEDILELDVHEDNSWWKLIRGITEMSARKAGGHHFVTYTALSGITDIISAIFGLEPFLMELIDNPSGVKRVSEHLIKIWIRVFRELSSIIETSGNEGCVACWPGVWSPGRSFTIQEDISYMLSREMFDEFCLPYIDALVQEMDYPFYHLDGKGATKLVDSVLGLEKLKVVQWIPGAGSGEMSQWYELIRHILANGKSVHLYADEKDIEPLIKAVGHKGLLINVGFNNMEAASRFADKYVR